MSFPTPKVIPRQWSYFIAWLLVFTGTARAQIQGVTPQFTQRTWRQQDGLRSNEIACLVLDRAGYLWIGSPAGLSRFDGAQFVTLEFSQRRTPADRAVNALVAAPDEGLVIAPRSGGLVRFAGGKFSPVTLPAALTGRVATALFYATDGALWSGFEGGIALRQLDGRAEVFDPSHGFSPQHSVHFARDGAGRTWLAGGSRLARYDHGALVPMAVRSDREQLRIASARENGPWVLADEWLYKVTGDSARATLVDKVNTYASAHYLQALLEDPSGALWLGTRSRGLRRLTPNDGDMRSIIQLPGDITAVVQDKSGDLWAGSHGGGLIRVSPGVLRNYDRSLGLLETHSLTVCQDQTGTLWFANRDGGIAYMNEAGSALAIEKPRQWQNFSAISVNPAPGEGVWVTTTHGILRVTRAGIQEQIELKPHDDGEAVRISYVARNGDLWCALAPGKLGRFRSSAWTIFGVREGLAAETVRTLAEDATGRIWAGTDQAGLFRQDGERFAAIPVPSPATLGAIQTLHFDARNIGWIGTEHGGLGRYDGRNLRFVTKNQGLPDNHVTVILGDDQNLLWFGYPTGVGYLARSELDAFFAGEKPLIYPVILGADEGLAEASCVGTYQPAAWKSTDGLLWFATREGVLAVNPARARAGPATLRTQIHSVRYLKGLHTFGREINLTYSDQTIELHYSALCLATPERVHTRYRLAGFDNRWTEPGFVSHAKYTRLPPGNYRFEVESRLAGVPGLVSRDSVQVIVVARWWQTLWFRLAVVAACVTALVFVVRAWSHRRLRARLATLESESALERERTRIARNLHDDLGAGLTRISLLTQSARQHNDRVQLDKIYSTVSELTQSMDAIVWAVNPQHDDLESVANYIIAYAQGFLSDADIRARVSLPDFLPGHTLTAQHRHHLFLSCKEALHNIVKHARATEVSLRLGVAAGVLTIVIADNGRGFPPPGAERPGRNGLANLRTRLADLGGTCEIHSTPAGTTLTLTAPLPSHTAL